MFYDQNAPPTIWPPLGNLIGSPDCLAAFKGAGSGMAGMAPAIPIKSKAANLFIISNKSRIKTSAFLYVSEPWVLSCDWSRKDSKHSHRAKVVYIYGEDTKSI